MKYILLFIAALLPGAAQACIMPEADKAALYRQFDANGDERLTIDEYVAGEMARHPNDHKANEDFFRQRFNVQMDKAKIGYISYRAFDPISDRKCG